MAGKWNQDIQQEDFQKAGVLLAQESLATVGINEAYLNQKAREALDAEEIQTHRHDGFLQPWVKLPAGYKIIKPGVGMSLISGPNWTIQDRVRVSCEKRLGLHPAEDLNVSHTFSDLMQDVLADVMDKTKGKLPSEDDE